MPRKKKEETSSKTSKSSAKKKEIKMKAAPKKASLSSTRGARKTAKATQPSVSVLSDNLPTPPSQRGSPQTKAASKTPVSAGQLPRKQETQVIAFVRDPQSIYAYWEVAPENVEEAKKKLKEEFKNSSLVLRMFHVNGNGSAEFLYEIEPAPGSVSRYLEVAGDGKSYFVEVGQKAGSGKYVSYARSRTLILGGNASAATVDPQWAPSPEMEKYYEEEVPTHSVPGPSSAQVQQVRKSKRWSPTSSSQR